jgi:hypothetical protein
MIAGAEAFERKYLTALAATYGYKRELLVIAGEFLGSVPESCMTPVPGSDVRKSAVKADY